MIFMDLKKAYDKFVYSGMWYDKVLYLVKKEMIILRKYEHVMKLEKK